jgi:hypothetical protein
MSCCVRYCRLPIATGGKVAAGLFDVMGFGRMAVIQDPAGAMNSIRQAKTHHGTGIVDVAGTVRRPDLTTPDQAGAARFHGAVYGWEADPGQDLSGYLHIKSGEKFWAGFLQ